LICAGTVMQISWEVSHKKCATYLTHWLLRDKCQ
jgi:hypothetical protein